MIWAESINKYYTDKATGDNYAVADLFSDNAPSPFPTDFSTVQRLGDKEPFSPDLKLGAGSTIYVVSDATLFIMDSSGNFVEQ